MSTDIIRDDKGEPTKIRKTDYVKWRYGQIVADAAPLEEEYERMLYPHILHQMGLNDGHLSMDPAKLKRQLALDNDTTVEVCIKVLSNPRLFYAKDGVYRSYRVDDQFKESARQQGKSNGGKARAAQGTRDEGGVLRSWLAEFDDLLEKRPDYEDGEGW